MIVRELIELLKTFDPELPVCYRMCSEYDLLEAKDITTGDLCEPRPDGWVHDQRPDKRHAKYVIFPGR